MIFSGKSDRQPEPPKRSFSDKIDEDVLNEKRPRLEKPQIPNELGAMYKDLKRDLQHYEATGSRSELIERLRKALSGIPPTSVESEETNISQILH